MLIPKPIACSELTINGQTRLYHTGPSLDKGAMPAVFYFALSGENSLCLDPFNQPVQFLSNDQVRIFSMTIPGHEAGLPPENALNVWADDMQNNHDLFSVFISQIKEAVEYVTEHSLTTQDQIAFAGLSRGGLIASIAAAHIPYIRYILLFAPLTILANAKEFAQMQNHPLVKKMNAFNYIDKLYDRHIRTYIGNHDTRVGTKAAFEYTSALVNEAISQNIRSAQIELFISQSVGHMGHGTPPHIFKSGANWLLECLFKI